MSENDPDEFDREAERRKLEEKYGENNDDDTRRMSELLLKGATMTNRHCGTCGDPLFRQNGEEFCPTCNAAGEAGEAVETARDATDQQAGETQQSTEAAGREAQPASRSDATREPADGSRVDANGRARAGDRAEQTTAVSRDRAEQTTAVSRDRAEQTTAVSRDRAAVESNAAGERQQPAPERGATAPGDLDEAREVLIAAVTRHARAGSEATDPRRAKDQFAAAREAAETLAVLRR